MKSMSLTPISYYLIYAENDQPTVYQFVIISYRQTPNITCNKNTTM